VGIFLSTRSCVAPFRVGERRNTRETSFMATDIVLLEEVRGNAPLDGNQETKEHLQVLGGLVPPLRWFVILLHSLKVYQLTFPVPGFVTITSTAVLFAKTVLFMPASSLIIVGVMVPTFGIIGSLAWPHLQRRLGFGNLRMVMILVILASLVPAYGCLGFLPVFQRIGFGGLNSPNEIYGLAVYFGMLLGIFPPFVRALDRSRDRFCVRCLPSLRSGVLRGTDS